MEMRGFVIPHWSTPPEPLQFFKLHPLVSYKFRPPPPIYWKKKKSDIAFSFLLSNSSSRVIHSALCVRNLPAFEYRYTGKVLNRSILGGIILLTLDTEKEIKFLKANQ